MPFIAVDFSFDLSYRPVGPSKQAISDKSDDPRSHKQGAKPCSVTLGRSGLTIGITFRAKTKPNTTSAVMRSLFHFGLVDQRVRVSSVLTKKDLPILLG